MKGDERANGMLIALHAGFLQSMFPLLFDVEFKLPAILAEALAQATVQDSQVGPFILDAEKAAASSGNRKAVELSCQM